jgi:putative tryptophan/tyrosine transport system substrate-binding protein
MERRAFLSLLGGAAVAPSFIWSLAARSQQAGRLPTIGFLGGATPSILAPWIAAFVQRLRELGWIEDRTIAIQYRWADGRSERYVEIAAEVVQLKVDVIVAAGTEVAAAASRATSSIPIVFPAAGDPVGNGLVASLARPGGNVTGLSNERTDLAGKRIELLRDMLPALHRLAIIGNVGAADSAIEMNETKAAAGKLGVDSVTYEIQRAEEIASAFTALGGRADALYVVSDPLIGSYMSQIITLAAGARLPTIFSLQDFVAAGGLMSYGPDFPDLFRRAADYVDKILRGAKPADLPVEQPTKFDLAINLRTAKALGLTVPQTILVSADQVIE